MAWYNNLGQRPRMPTQEEIDAMNAARQAGRTLKEGVGGQTAADVRRLQAGISPALPQEPPPQNRAGPLSQASIRPAIAAMGSGIQSFAYPEEMQMFAPPPVPAIPGPAPAEVAPAPPSSPARPTAIGMDMPERIARSQPGWSQAQQRAGTLRDLSEQGFAPVSSLPGGRDEMGRSYLGPNSIMVREGQVGPEAYAAAMQDQQDAEAFGRRMGFQRSEGYGGYAPNLPTQQALQEGGPTTEYVVPGKGSATFLGKRRGGGSFSVVSGRTPEEQALIDRNVASIDRQTAAMRDLRNAERQARGLGSLEEEIQQNEFMRLADRIMKNYGENAPAALEILKQAQLDKAVRGNAEQGQRASAQAQREAQESQRRWEAEQGLRQQQENRARTEFGVKTAMDYDKMVQDSLKEERLKPETTATILNEFMSNDLSGAPVFNHGAFQDRHNIPTASATQPPEVGRVTFDPSTGGYFVVVAGGEVIPLGGADAAYEYMHAQARQRMMQEQLQRRRG